VRTPAHQSQFHLVLHFFNVKSATGRLVTQQCIDHGSGQLLHHVAHAGARRLVPAIDGEECLGQCDRDFLRLERCDRTIAANDLVIGVAGFRVSASTGGICGNGKRGVRRVEIGCDAHIRGSCIFLY